MSQLTGCSVSQSVLNLLLFSAPTGQSFCILSWELKNKTNEKSYWKFLKVNGTNFIRFPTFKKKQDRKEKGRYLILSWIRLLTPEYLMSTITIVSWLLRLLDLFFQYWKVLREISRICTLVSLINVEAGVNVEEVPKIENH